MHISIRSFIAAFLFYATTVHSQSVSFVTISTPLPQSVNAPTSTTIPSLLGFGNPVVSCDGAHPSPEVDSSFAGLLDTATDNFCNSHDKASIAPGNMLAASETLKTVNNAPYSAVYMIQWNNTGPGSDGSSFTVVGDSCTEVSNRYGFNAVLSMRTLTLFFYQMFNILLNTCRYTGENYQLSYDDGTLNLLSGLLIYSIGYAV
jgi:hypothetical protein